MQGASAGGCCSSEWIMSETRVLFTQIFVIFHAKMLFLVLIVLSGFCFRFLELVFSAGWAAPWRIESHAQKVLLLVHGKNKSIVALNTD